MMMKTNPTLIHISEPLLTFGFGQEMEDPRDGLTLFGPHSRNRHKGQISVGIIGPQAQRIYVRDYLASIMQPVLNSIGEIARPYFPGLEAAFDISINFNAIQEIDVPSQEINDFLKYTDGHQRVHNLTNLFSDRLQAYQKEEDIPVTVWIIAIPEDIYRFGKPKSKIPRAEDNTTLSLPKKERGKENPFLFEELNELKEAYEFEVNFHNQLKAKLLGHKIVTQIIRDSKIAYRHLLIDPDKIEKEAIFDTAKAWGISTALYYKSGGLPWKLGAVRQGVCYLGLVYKQTTFAGERDNACCAAQMFLDSGDGMIFRGNIGPWYNPDTGEFHIDEGAARDLVSKSLEAFKNKSGKYPAEIFIHAKTGFNDNEWIGFSSGAEGKSKIVGIKIRDDNTFKLYRHFAYCVPRGTALFLSSKVGFLWTKGFIPRLKTQIGLETPNPLSVEIIRGSADLGTVCADILALTKLNYNSCIFADGLPVTLRFADAIGEILTAGRDVESDVLSFKHYI